MAVFRLIFPLPICARSCAVDIDHSAPNITFSSTIRMDGPISLKKILLKPYEIIPWDVFPSPPSSVPISPSNIAISSPATNKLNLCPCQLPKIADKCAVYYVPHHTPLTKPHNTTHIQTHLHKRKRKHMRAVVAVVVVVAMAAGTVAVVAVVPVVTAAPTGRGDADEGRSPPAPSPHVCVCVCVFRGMSGCGRCCHHVTMLPPCYPHV